jgi:hypothetical protein
MSVIYLLDAMGILSGPVTIPEIPGLGRVLPANAVELPELAAARPGHVWVYRDGRSVELLDARGTYYRATNGERVEHTGLGDLPRGLTPEPRPGPHHVWQGGAWVLDEATQLASVEAVERSWRDARIAATDYLVLTDYPLTEASRAELYAYRQALRDWPQSEAFPAQADRPQPPEWLAGQLAAA